MVVPLKFLLQKKVCRLFVVVQILLLQNFMESTFGYLALQSTCTAVGYFKRCGLKKKLKLDCSEFGVVEINKTVDSTYINYQSPPMSKVILVLIQHNLIVMLITEWFTLFSQLRLFLIHLYFLYNIKALKQRRGLF